MDKIKGTFITHNIMKIAEEMVALHKIWNSWCLQPVSKNYFYQLIYGEDIDQIYAASWNRQMRRENQSGSCGGILRLL